MSFLETGLLNCESPHLYPKIGLQLKVVMVRLARAGCPTSSHHDKICVLMVIATSYSQACCMQNILGLLFVRLE